jgi:hypothetical protein
MATKYITKAILLFAFSMTGYCTLNAQINARDNDSLIQRRIRAQQFVFVPQSVSSSYVTMPINSVGYSVSVTTDSVIGVLPYNGRSYTVRHDRSDDEGMKFVSTNFKYSSVAKKKGKWEITIEPIDAKGIRLFLTVFNNGDAEMDVESPAKETMLFKGYVW